MYVEVDPLRVGHILEHDVADLQRRFAEADLEQLNRTDLPNVSHPDETRCRGLHLADRIVVFHSQESGRQ